MRVCEICGSEENKTNGEQEQLDEVILHLCENCRQDRNHSH